MRFVPGLLVVPVALMLVSLASAAACFSRTSHPATAAPIPTVPAIRPTPGAPTPAGAVTPSPTPRQVSLPADDAPHPDTQTEWWYYNGHLEALGGRQFGFHYVVFAVRIPGFPPVRIAHFAITDVEKRVNVTNQRADFGSAQASPAEGFDFDIRGWRVVGSTGDDRLIAQAGQYALDLDFHSTKTPVLHGGTGSLDVSSAGQDSYYYSRTRMDVRGSISDGAEAVDVSGTAWFDHQWGNFSALAIGWDWFALQLDDSFEAMLYRIRDLDTADEFDYGTLVDPEGQASELARGDFEISSIDTWISPATGIAYPSGWSVNIPSRGIEIEVRPPVEASEFDARATTRNVYWEGLVRVTGSHSGWGFVELVGYGPPAPAPTPATR